MVVYLDSGDFKTIDEFAPRVFGFTTNPSLLSANGVKDYRDFARTVLSIIGNKPVSFEVFSDELDGMENQALEISSWGDNVYVKIPVTNTKGISTAPLMKRLCSMGVKVNATAVFTHDQINTVARSLAGPSILSIFCGRIADTGRDPVSFITHALNVKAHETKVLWASTREVLNVKQARMCGADIITMSPSLIEKMYLFDKDLSAYSLETVQQFFDDARGLSL